MKWPAKICRTLSPTSDVGLKVLQIFAILFFLGFLVSFNTSLASTVNSSSPESKYLTKGLVGHWTFDSKDLKNNVADRSGLGNTGYMSGFTSTSTAVTKGKIGQGLKFDGVNDRINTSSDFITVGTSTFSAWIYPRSFGEGGGGQIINNGKVRFQVFATGNKLSFSSDNNSTGYQSAANAIILNKWSFVTAIRNGAGQCDLYINGVRDTTYASMTRNCGIPVSGTTNVFIGNRSGSDFTFDGVIDNVRVYSRALSASEIKELYNIGTSKFNSSFSPGDLSRGLVGWWTFESKDMKNNVRDRSGNNNTGYMSGFTSTSTAVTRGKIGQGLRFDGVNDYVNLNSPSSLAMNNSNAFTFTAWAYPLNNTSNPGDIIIRGSSLNSADATVYYLAQSASGWVGRVSDGTTRITLTTSAGTLATNTWQHIALVWNGGTKTLKIFKNGISIGTATDVAFNTLWDGDDAADRKTSIGADTRVDPRHYFRGNMDDMRMYNRALSVSEILDIYKDTGSGGGTLPPAGDTDAPSVPFNITASTVSSTQVNLSWNASTDNVAVTGYIIYRNSVQIATSDTNSYSDTTVSPSFQYLYSVAAYDAAGNVSSHDSTFTVSTPANTTTPPPENLPPSGNMLYVSTNGSDTNPGTQTSPFRTVQKAADMAVAGNTVIVLPGEYNEQVILKNSGTAGNKITFQGSNRQAKILHGFNINALQYINIENFSITSDTGGYQRGVS